MTHEDFIKTLESDPFDPVNYKKTDIKTKPKRIGQVFFLEKGKKPAIINAKITMAAGFTKSGKPKTKTKWHYTYLKHSNWNMFYGGYMGKNIAPKDIVEAVYMKELCNEISNSH